MSFNNFFDSKYSAGPYEKTFFSYNIVLRIFNEGIWLYGEGPSLIYEIKKNLWRPLYLQ